MKYKHKFLNLILLLILAVSCSSSNQSGELKILFIGNSYTYYNSMPEVLKGLISERSPDMQVEATLISGGGMTLANHWEQKRALEAIQSQDWDYVVLQDQSKLGMGIIIDDKDYFGQTDLFFEYSRKFDAEIKKAGAQTVFMMTWSRKAEPQNQAILNYAYSTIAKELGAMLAPVGLVWDELREESALDLYVNDGSHPSAMGSYLAASTLFATLLEDNPQGLSPKVSGYPLSNRGEAAPETADLIDITEDQAALIQKVSWTVVEAMNASEDYLDFDEVEPAYTIPVLTEGESLDLSALSGSWYGTSTYGDYIGQVLDIREENGTAVVSLSFYSPHTVDKMEVEKVKLEEKILSIDVFDALRDRKSTVRLALKGEEIKGLLEAPGNYHMYKHLNFSRDAQVNGVDLSALADLMQAMEGNIKQMGFVKAAKKHYEGYSELIGEAYQPEEFFLNAVGYNYLREGKIDDALNLFDLAMAYYPNSVNTYDSYAEALVVAGRKEEALAIYEKALTLGRKTNYENLDYIEGNYNKLKNNTAPSPQGGAVPPPPPPPPSPK